METMRKNKAIRLICFITSCAITLGLVLGSSVVAYADDSITIGGVVCSPVEITYEQIKAMFDNSQITAAIMLSASTEANISLYDMENQTSSVVTIGTDRVIYNCTDCDIVTAGSTSYLNFSLPYSYNLRVNDSTTFETYFSIEFPFPYYLSDFFMGCRFNYSGLSNDQNTNLIFGVRESDSSTNTYSVSVNRQVGYWSSSGLTRNWYSKYNWVPNGYSYNAVENEGVRTAYSYGSYSGISSDTLVDSIYYSGSATYVHAAGTGWDNFFPAPMLVSIRLSTTVYVPASYEEAVIEYLDLITGDPTSENQARIDELVEEFETKEQELLDLAEDLTVTVPDTSGAIAGLPEEAQDGADAFATYIFNPIYNYPIVMILVSCALGFAVLKLILYGSGAS